MVRRDGSEWHQVFVGIGSNLGDRKRNIRLAFGLLGQLSGTVVAHQSPLYENDPVGGPPQGAFLNGVIELQTTLDPRTLLTLLKGIEKNLGRKDDGVHWGPRVLDLDILLYERLVLDIGDLKIPHPLMHEREFVLRPMMEIAPMAYHPVLMQTVRELWRQWCLREGATVSTMQRV